jgi:hypothetical protein
MEIAQAILLINNSEPGFVNILFVLFFRQVVLCQVIIILLPAKS